MTSLIGQTIAGKYRIEELIGRGGMAEVYRVWDVERVTYRAMRLLHGDLVGRLLARKRLKFTLELGCW